MASVETTSSRRTSGRGLLWAGLGLAVAAVAAYLAQFAAQRLFTPWYMPVATTLAAVMIGAAFCKVHSVWRGLALAVVLVFGGAEWALLFVTRLPPYTGPVTVGQPFPEFTTTRADGTAFSHRDLQGGANTVLVFFRGHW